MAIRKLTPAIHDKVWGSPRTQPWLENPEGRRLGEIWFAAPEALPILVKLLFTSERLSVQVHPDDAYARDHGHARGKTEMWHILRAEPDASVALGLREPVTAEFLSEAALDGSIVDLLRWVRANEGDTFFVPAGTIHAIGGGLVLCEIQQFSDLTYRLFDYQRKPERPLHLKESLTTAQLAPTDNRRQAAPIGKGRELLAECDYFRTERLNVRGTVECPSMQQPAIYVAVAGEGSICGEPFRAGEAWLAVSDTQNVTVESTEATFVIARLP